MLASKAKSSLFILLLVGWAPACVSTRVYDSESDRLFHAGEYEKAASRLEAGYRKGAGEASGSGGAFEDELLYLLDWALALHTAGNYEASNAAFALAERHVWGNDYTSTTEEIGTLVTGENTKVYRGEDFEKLLIHVYKALNYALLGNGESALVEARLVDRRLQELKTEGEKGYKQNAFARYLSGVLYESQREWNDAYIDYKKTLEIEPDFTPIGEDLMRVALRLGMSDQVERWERQFGLTRPRGRSGSGAEIVVIFQNGLGPVKVPRPEAPALPKFKRRYNPVRHAEVTVDGEGRGTTTVLHNIEATAIRNLDERIAGMTAKRVGGRLVKAGVAGAVAKRTNNEALGQLTYLLLVASDQADLRSWRLLPRDLQILRVPVEPGVHEVRVRPVGDSELPPQSVEVKTGQKKLVNFRYIPH